MWQTALQIPWHCSEIVFSCPCLEILTGTSLYFYNQPLSTCEHIYPYWLLFFSLLYFSSILIQLLFLSLFLHPTSSLLAILVNFSPLPLSPPLSPFFHLCYRRPWTSIHRRLLLGPPLPSNLPRRSLSRLTSQCRQPPSIASPRPVTPITYIYSPLPLPCPFTCTVCVHMYVCLYVYHPIQVYQVQYRQVVDRCNRYIQNNHVFVHSGLYH